MENPQKFLSSKKYIPLQQKYDFELEMKIACESSPVIVEKHFNDVIYKLVTQMQEYSEGLTILTDIQGVLSDQVSYLNEVNNKIMKNQDELKDVMNTNQKHVTDGITKILDTLNEKLQNDIQIQGKKQIKVVERTNRVEADIVVDKDKRIKVKEEQDEELVAVLKEDQIDVKKRVAVTQAEFSMIKGTTKCLHLVNQETITDTKSSIPSLREEFVDKIANQSLFDGKDQMFSPNDIPRLDELITDDGSSHSLQMKESDWYLCCHHDQNNQPEILLNSFDRNKYSPGDKKVLKIYQCGDSKYDNEAGYMKYLNDKFDEQFGKDLTQQPWLLTNLHEDCVDNRNFYQLCKDVNSFCQNKKYSFLLIDVSIEDNFKNLGFEINKVKEQLKIHDAEDPLNRIMVYIGENDIIFNIRFVDSNNEKDISDAVRKGQNDTKLFCSLYQDILQKASINFVSIVVTNTTNKNLLEIKTCLRCVSENLIISNRELHTSLESIVQRRGKRKVSPSSSVSTESTFISLASRLWGTLCIRDVHLPNLCTDGDSALERIYLNGAQRRFLHSRKKHILLRGGYGSGKSVCAQEKFKYLIQNAKATEDIFYLCFNDDTLFKSVLKQQIKETVNHQLRPEQVSIMNAKEYGMQFGLLPPYMFSEILQDINERSKQTSNKPHVIADEYDSSYLTSSEAYDIGKNLKEMKDSYVLLIPQSLETVRKGVTTKRFKKHEEKYEGQEFELTGMTIKVLDSIMRNTNSINELSQATIRELEKCKSTIYVSDSPLPVKATTKKEYLENAENVFKLTNELVIHNSSEYHLRENTPRDCDEPSTSNDNTNCDKVDREMEIIDTALSKSIECNKINLDSKKVQTNALLKEKQFRVGTNSTPVNFYHVLKKMNPSAKKSGSKAIESRFHFPGKGKHGHKVTGKIPTLIDPFKNSEMNYNTINNIDTKMKFVFAIQNIVKIREKFKGMAVIVFEPIEAQIFHAIFRSMDINTIVYTPAISTGLTQTNADDMVDKLKDHVLVTDHVGARGLEFKYLIVTINPNEVYLYQYLVEAFTRCMYELHFIVFNTAINIKGEFSCGNIIKLWEKKKLVQKYEIELCDLHEEDGEYFDLYCTKKNHYYHIHTWHKDFKIAKTIDYIIPVSESDDQLRIQYNKLLSHAYLQQEVRRKQDEQVLSKSCIRRGHKTYRDIILGNEKHVVEMLLKGQDNSYITNFRDVDGNSLLDIAFLHCCKNSIEAMENLKCSLNYEKLIAQNNRLVISLLLRFKKNYVVDYRDDHGNTLLHLASDNGWDHCVKGLSYSKLRNIKNKENKLPIDLALSNKNNSIIDLLSKEIDVVNMIKEYDKTKNQIEYVEDLISNDRRNELNVLLFNRDLISEHEKTLFNSASRHKNVDLFELFILHKYPHIVDGASFNEQSVLQIAAQHITMEVIEFFLENYPHIISIKNIIGNTILHEAAANGNEELVKIILQKYPYMVDVRNNKNYTALHVAFLNGYEEVMKIILHKCPYFIDIKDDYGDTILHKAAWYGRKDVVEFILENYSHSIGVKNNGGNTFLHEAAWNGNEEVVKIILQKCPQVIDMKNKNERTAYQEAHVMNRRNITILMDTWYKN